MLHYKHNNRTLININLLLMLFYLTPMTYIVIDLRDNNGNNINVIIYQDTIIKTYLTMIT